MSPIHRPSQPGASLARIATPRPGDFQPIPAAYQRKPPFDFDLASVLTRAEVREITQAGSMAFHCVGDTGGVKDPTSQHLVARGLLQSLHGPQLSPSLRGAAMHPAFCYHLGDVVYYNGEVDKYYDQYYEPYDQYPLPFVAIPGNHDGDPINAQATSLEGFYRNFLATPADGKPVYTEESKDSGRPAMQLPYFYHTMTTPFATFIGLYSNVPEHGILDSHQRAWFHTQMKQADPHKALIVSVHHPIYSFDIYHSGSPTMAEELQNAINKTRRVPNMVLNAHVHNYQRIEQQAGAITIPFFVIGGGGYWNLHQLAAAQGYKDPETGARLISAIDSRHGFMTFEISDTVINGNYTTVPRPQESWTDPQAYNASFDVFSYPATPVFLAKGENVTLVPPDGTNIPPHLDPSQPAPAPTERAAQRIAAKRAHAERTARKLHGHHAPGD
jgi:hypothetical protein